MTLWYQIVNVEILWWVCVLYAVCKVVVQTLFLDLYSPVGKKNPLTFWVLFDSPVTSSTYLLGKAREPDMPFITSTLPSRKILFYIFFIQLVWGILHVFRGKPIWKIKCCTFLSDDFFHPNHLELCISGRPWVSEIRIVLVNGRPLFATSCPTFPTADAKGNQIWPQVIFVDDVTLLSSQSMLEYEIEPLKIFES